jgi:hypothetical protein
MILGKKQSSWIAVAGSMTKPAAASTLLWPANSIVLTGDANDLYSRLN